MEKIHFKQAEYWLKGSQQIAQMPGDEKEKYAVAVAMCVHAIIKANDALTYKYLNLTAKRHDDARRHFEDLIKKNIIKSEYANYKNYIQDAISNKAKAEYRGSFFSKRDYEDLRRKAEKFIKMAKEYV
tara:strand:+ start:6676 stop:7059 length:384 start_codon:yes stop_codon:yes gene_type:complete